MKKIILFISAFLFSGAVLFSQNIDNVSRVKKQLDSIMAVSGKESSAYALMLHQLGNAYMSIKDYDSAKKAFNESLSLKEKTLGKNTCEYARSLNNLGAIEEDLKNYDIALDYFSRAYDINKTNVKTHSDSLLFAINTTNYGSVAFNCKSYDLSIQKLQEGINVYKKLGMSYNEYLSMCTLGSIYDNLGMIKEEIENCKERLPLIKQFSDTTNYMYAATLKLIGDCYERIGDIKNAQPYFLRSVEIPSYEREDDDYYAYKSLALYALQFGDNKNAINYSEKYCNLIKKKFSESNIEYVVGLLLVGEAKSNLRLDKEAIIDLNKGLTILMNIGDNGPYGHDPSYYYHLIFISDLGKANTQIGNYSAGHEYFQKALLMLDNNKKYFGNSYNDLYVSSLSNLVMSSTSLGNYAKAIDYGSMCLAYIKDNGVKSSELQLAMLYLNLGGAYYFTNDYYSTLDYFYKASETMSKLGKYNSLENAQAMFGCAQVLYRIGDKKCVNYQNEAIKIMRLNGIAESSRDLCNAVTLSAIINVEFVDKSENSINASINLLEKTLLNTVKRVGVKSYDYAYVLNNLGWLYFFYKHDAKNAIKSYEQACSILGDIHLENGLYFNSLCNLVSANYTNNLSNNIYIPHIIKYLDRYVNDYYTFLPEYVRGHLSDISHEKSLLFSGDIVNFNTIELYNYLLKFKGLALNSSQEINRLINSVKDEQLHDKWNRLMQLKQRIEQLSSDISLDHFNIIDSIKRETNMLESQILNVLPEYRIKLNYLNLTLSDVQKKLKSKDLAIEFVDYLQLEKGFRESTHTKYAAMLMKKGWDKPKYIPLFDESELNSLTVNNPSNAYSANANGPKLYSLIWRKLEPYMTKGADVYFSPSGKLWTLSIENITDGKGEVISDIYRMHRVSSTKNICIPTETKIYSNAVLYGGLAYDVNDDVLTAENEKYNSSNTLYAMRGNDIERDSTRSGWNYLTGTLDEVNVIDSELKSDNINVTLFTGNDGVEGSIKSLSGKSPDILHIATHGFFLSNTQTSGNAFFSPLADNVSTGIDPLLRSGLIMSGGNKAWKYGQSGDSNADGILTAREVNSLDFSNTDLLVLSACETGLGEVGSQGVFGLQRAFKHAGVKTIIMSLWKVNDDATRLMMQSFYSNLLKGCSKETAFNMAKAEVRKKYDSPYYWAAFIMLD
ncbi:MAG: CHAT domain-containing protein [Bacteroidales bacterium]|jgi:CHAT domain-containing protein/tetratricopeptide (TPR) repeat protein|nr:CHAT domain-containing protein [Bacteroidales bacterium]